MQNFSKSCLPSQLSQKPFFKNAPYIPLFFSFGDKVLKKLSTKCGNVDNFGGFLGFLPIFPHCIFINRREYL